MRGLALRRRTVSAIAVAGLAIIAFAALSGLAITAEEVQSSSSAARLAAKATQANDAECMLFSPAGREFRLVARDRYALSTLTQQFQARVALPAAKATPVPRRKASTYTTTIDREIFGALETAGVTPAAPITDLEFIRRVSLDLTGRVPRPERVIAFVEDSNAAKREALVDEFLASPEYVDKWTMFFGDLFKNNTVNQQIARFIEGRDAFRRWIREAVSNNKPYD